MADISKITLPSGDTYDLKDAKATHGLFFVSYGNTTYAECLAAYQAKEVIYCKASSNSNPATGSQNRLAFLAYVNNSETPTEFEFQYYRSVATHSDSQQGDQIYVYKLKSASGWEVTTREAYTKVVAGTDLSSSYSSGKITLNHDTSGVTAASKGDSSNQTPGFGDTFKALSGTVTANGHLSAFDEHTVTIPNTEATTSASGLMSSTDKSKLNDMSTIRVNNNILEQNVNNTWSSINISKQPINLSVNVWEAGSISSATGENSNGSARIRTKNYLPMSVVSILPNEGYQYCLVAYSADGEYVGQYNGTKFVKTGIWRTVETNLKDLGSYQYRLVGAKVDSSSITTTEGSNNICCYSNSECLASIGNISQGIEYILGTWSSTTGTWTGVTKDRVLYEGKIIMLFMPYGSDGNVTLNLTVPDSSTTGGKNVYLHSTTRLTTQYSQYSHIMLMYHHALTINNSDYEGWWVIPSLPIYNGGVST